MKGSWYLYQIYGGGILFHIPITQWEGGREIHPATVQSVQQIYQSQLSCNIINLHHYSRPTIQPGQEIFISGNIDLFSLNLSVRKKKGWKVANIANCTQMYSKYL